MNKSSQLLVLALVSAFVLIASADNKCENCKTLAKGILDGLDKTKKKNFEGGDVAWEEKKLGKYKTSETRLVEVLETYACSKDNHKCNALLEEKEDSIYEWYNKLQDDMSLYDYLCVQEAEVCCPEGTFGPECQECPKGDSGKICYGRGTCSGDGDKEGTGECICNEGYGGELCNDCGEGHFETFRNDTYIMCSLCHNSCATCKGNKSSECITCKAGFRQEENIDNEDEIKCTDINECVEKKNLCSVGTYCLNNEGSYSCEGAEKAKPAAKPEGERVEIGDAVEPASDSLSDEDIKRLAVAFVICLIGTAAAKGDLIWTALFFVSLLCAGLWWAADKSDQLMDHFTKHHREL